MRSYNIGFFVNLFLMICIVNYMRLSKIMNKYFMCFRSFRNCMGCIVMRVIFVIFEIFFFLEEISDYLFIIIVFLKRRLIVRIIMSI